MTGDPLRAAAVSCAILWAVAAAGSSSWTIGFERDGEPWVVPGESDTGGAAVRRIGVEEGALAGRFSLAGDSMGLETPWHEILHTTEEVRFEPGRLYTIRFQYRIDDIDPGVRGARPAFYFLLRSRSRGPNDATDVYGPFWRREKGARSDAGAVLAPAAGVTDSYLIIGILRRARFVVDDLRIEEAPAQAPGFDRPVGIDWPSRAEAWRSLAEVRARRGLSRLLEEMTVVGIFESCNGTMPEVVDFMRREIRPDAIDWASARHPGQMSLRREEGAWYTTSALEYQELYRVEAPEIWEERWGRFLEAGMTRTLAGQINSWETFGEGGFYMCHNGSAWRDYYRDRTIGVIDRGDGVCQDNIGVPPFTTAGGCFCAACEDLFRDQLLRSHSREELAARGIDNPEGFSFRDYALRYGLVGDRALRDATAREYVLFQYRTHRDRWMDHALAFKRVAETEGRTFSVSGNQIQTACPFPLLLSPVNDVIEVERLVEFPDFRPRRNGWACRLYRASGYDRRPVWFRGTARMGPDRRLMDSAAWQEAAYGEAVAHGAFRTIHMADDSWPRGFVSRAFVRMPEMRTMTARWAEMLRRHRALFLGRRSLARVGIVCSLPTMIWSQFPALGIEDPEPAALFEEISNRLEALHVPHDAVLFGYPGLWNDAWSLERLGDYDALLVPRGDCLSDRQMEALRRYAEDGGELYVDGRFAMRDENRTARSRIPSWVSEVARRADWNAADLARLACRFGLETDAPPTLLIEPWASEEGDVLAFHLVNYDVDMKEDRVVPPGVVTLRFPIPEDLSVPRNGARLLTIDGWGSAMPVSGNAETGKIAVRFDLSRPYGVIVFAGDAVLKRREEEIRKRRADIRRRIREAASAEGVASP